MAEPSMSTNPSAYDTTTPPQYGQTTSPYSADAIGSSSQAKDSGPYQQPSYTGTNSAYISPEHTGAAPPGAVPGVGGIHQGAYTGPGAGSGLGQAYEMETPMQHGHGQGQGGYQQEAYGKAEPGLAGNQHQPQGHGGYYANAGAGAGQTQYYGPQAAQGALPGHQQGHGAQGQGVGVGAAGTAPPDYSKFRTAVPISALSSSAAPVDCPSCHQRAMTATKLESGNTTNGWAAGLCLLACLGCIPYCISSTKDVIHKCGNCGVNLATWHRSGRTEVHLHS